MVRNAQGIYIDEHKGLYIPQNTFSAAHAIDECRRAQPFRDGQLDGIPASQFDVAPGHVRNQIDSKPCHGLTSSAETSFYASSDSEDKYGMVKVESDDEKWEIKQEEAGRMDE
jgi:hypothetical protein